MRKLGPLYKTTIVIWSEFDGSTVEIDRLADDAVRGDSLCSKSESVLVPVPTDDPEFPDTDFFGPYEGDEEGS